MEQDLLRLEELCRKYNSLSRLDELSTPGLLRMYSELTTLKVEAIFWLLVVEYMLQRSEFQRAIKEPLCNITGFAAITIQSKYPVSTFLIICPFAMICFRVFNTS